MFIGKFLSSVLSKLPSAKKGADLEQSDELDDLVANIAAADAAAGGKGPAPAGNGENKDIDRFFTKMNNTPQTLEVEDKAREILAGAVEEKPKAEVKPPPVDKPAEKPKEAAPKAAEGSQDKGGLMDSLFEADETEENSAITNLIASLPDVNMEELVSGANELKSLIAERKAIEKVSK